MTTPTWDAPGAILRFANAAAAFSCTKPGALGGVPTSADVERFYEGYAKANLLERVPYVLAGALASVIEQQTDPRMMTLMKEFDFHKVIDNSVVSRLVNEGFFEKLFGPGIKAEQDRKARLAFK